MQMECLNHFYLALFNRASTSLLGSSILVQSSRVTCLERRTRVITNSTSLGFIYATRYYSDQPDQPVIPKDFNHFFLWQERLVPSFETESSLSRVPWWPRCRVWSSLESESESSNSWTSCSRSVRGKNGRVFALVLEQLLKISRCCWASLQPASSLHSYYIHS